jgi:4-amino-4-deoxy-L-arabinose transferase-like glycosyltransferase
VAFLGLCLFVAVAGVWNVAHYNPDWGYDASHHIDYARGLVWGFDLPHGEGEYYTPPGYYLVAGIGTWVAEQLGTMNRPERGGMAVNVLFLLGTLVLVRQLARELWPGREWFALGAPAFVAFMPVTVKSSTMFHPETMTMFLCTLALWLGVRTFADPRYALALGVALGAAQLVRAFALWTVAATAIALLVGRRWRELVVAMLIAVAIPAPWYLHQRLEYGGSPAFAGRPIPDFGRDASGKPKPFYERRPLEFYVDPGVPEVVTKPYRENFLNLALPTTYSELWGDYFGIWVWTGVGYPPERADDLVRQSVVGLLPTLLAVVGWLAFLLASLRSPPRLAVALLPALGIVGYLYFTVSYPTTDGDVLKGTYMLTTTPGWALGFGYALERLRGAVRLVVVGLLAVCVLAELGFLFH